MRAQDCTHWCQGGPIHWLWNRGLRDLLRSGGGADGAPGERAEDGPAARGARHAAAGDDGGEGTAADAHAHPRPPRARLSRVDAAVFSPRPFRPNVSSSEGAVATAAGEFGGGARRVYDEEVRRAIYPREYPPYNTMYCRSLNGK